MTDLEMTRICARAIGLSVELVRGTYRERVNGYVVAPGGTIGPCYDPLHDDAQAMALVKQFRLWISPHQKIRGT